MNTINLPDMTASEWEAYCEQVAREQATKTLAARAKADAAKYSGGSPMIQAALDRKAQRLARSERAS